MDAVRGSEIAPFDATTLGVFLFPSLMPNIYLAPFFSYLLMFVPSARSSATNTMAIYDRSRHYLSSKVKILSLSHWETVNFEIGIMITREPMNARKFEASHNVTKLNLYVATGNGKIGHLFTKGKCYDSETISYFSKSLRKTIETFMKAYSRRNMYQLKALKYGIISFTMNFSANRHVTNSETLKTQ